MAAREPSKYSCLPDRYGDWGLGGRVDHKERFQFGRIDAKASVAATNAEGPVRAATAGASTAVFYPPRRHCKHWTPLTFSKFPTHVPDPLDAKIAAARERAARYVLVSTCHN